MNQGLNTTPNRMPTTGYGAFPTQTNNNMGMGYGMNQTPNYNMGMGMGMGMGMNNGFQGNNMGYQGSYQNQGLKK